VEQPGGFSNGPRYFLMGPKFTAEDAVSYYLNVKVPAISMAIDTGSDKIKMVKDAG